MSSVSPAPLPRMNTDKEREDHVRRKRYLPALIATVVEPGTRWYGVRGALRQGFAVDVGAIAGCELYLRMPAQPGHEAILRAFRQRVHDPSALEIHEDRPIGVAPPESEVVHT